jgi:hypothetical protein
MERIEIEPGSVAQVKRALSGRLVFVPDDVCNVVRDLQRIDRRFRVQAAEDLSLYIVFLEESDGSQQLVTNARHLDQRLVKRIQEIADERYDFVAELDRVEAAADRAFEARQREQIGDLGERLAHALRKDLGRHEAPNTLKSRAAGFALKD